MVKKFLKITTNKQRKKIKLVNILGFLILCCFLRCDQAVRKLLQPNWTNLERYVEQPHNKSMILQIKENK